MDFAAALTEQNIGHQIDLLHKLKGSCQAVAACRMIEQIARTEALQSLGEPLMPSRLLHHLQSVEAELRVIVGKDSTK